MKIAMIGYGKMGRTIEQLASKQGHEVVLKINVDNLNEFTAKKLQQADVAIEFSQPDVAYDNIMTCLKAGLPVVSGTTAWLDKYEEVKDWCLANDGAFFYASNFSIGVNIFFELNKHLAKIMSNHPSYQVDIEEIHHTQKLDAPSGTAVTLAEGILEKIDTLQGYQLQEGNQEIKDNCIPIIAKRIGNTPGTHVIKYHSAIDELEIKHTANGREGFASGAITAAHWLIGKKGIFGMNDLLELS
jgi:4-hydroxy-tetrahydrodipicolinate reductase